MSIGEIPKPAGVAVTVAMLVASNLFMTFAWYWHLRAQKPGASSWPLSELAESASQKPSKVARTTVSELSQPSAAIAPIVP